MNPSLAEGPPFTALEAMAAGLPVVATHAGGLAEIVVDGETGVLVPAGDARALAEAVRALVNAPARARALGAAGRRRVEQEYTADAMLGRLISVYDKVMEKAQPR